MWFQKWARDGKKVRRGHSCYIFSLMALACALAYFITASFQTHHKMRLELSKEIWSLAQKPPKLDMTALRMIPPQSIAPVAPTNDALSRHRHSIVTRASNAQTHLMDSSGSVSSNLLEQSGIAPENGIGPESEKHLKLSGKSTKKEHKSTCPEGIVAFTYATHAGKDDRFCRMLESSVRAGIHIKVLGWGKNWRGLSQKLYGSRDAISSLSDDCIVMFTDGFDVMFTQNLQQIKKKFLSSGKSLLFSGECGCWPLVTRGREWCNELYPRAPPNSYRFLNSGGWIGMKKQAEYMLNDVVKSAKESNNPEVNDQELVNIAYMKNRLNISIDHYASIFQCLHYVIDMNRPRILPNCQPYKKHMLWDQQNMTWYNTKTKSYPSVFHFNGVGKSFHLDFEKHLAYKVDGFYSKSDADMIYRQKIDLAGNMTPFGDVCPGHLEKTRNGKTYTNSAPKKKRIFPVG